MKMAITLTPEEVAAIVKEHLEGKFKTVGRVKMEVGQELQGNGMYEQYHTVFKGASCDVEM